LSGCTFAAIKSVDVYKKDLRFSPTNPNKVQVFLMAPTDRQFDEIGQVVIDNPRGNLQELAFKVKAAEMGGDAVYIKYQSFNSRRLNVFTGLTATGVVIKFKEGGALK